MNAKQNPEPALNTVNLLNAVLCADCEVISDSDGEVCAVCGSRSLLSLGRVLGGSIGDERAVLVLARHVYAAGQSRSVDHAASFKALDQTAPARKIGQLTPGLSVRFNSTP
jgi:hypothetical protein